MAHQLLNAAQVRPAVQQVSGEAMAQRVRRGALGDANPCCPRAQPPTRRRSCPAAGHSCSRTKHHSASFTPKPTCSTRASLPYASGGARQRRAGTLQITPNGCHRGLAYRYEARLSPLALNPQLLTVVIHVGTAQRHDLLRTQPTRVRKLEQSAVPYGQWIGRLGSRPAAVLPHERSRHAANARGAVAWRRDQRGCGRSAVLALAREQRPQRGQLARRRARRGAGPAGVRSDRCAI